ncbi:MAG TPA: Ku protein [Planktothrix sp.]
MARAIWSGVIGFGMVSIPVKLYTATGSKSISFHLLHDKCKTRIKEVRWCPHCDVEVAYEHTVRGYEYSKGHYVEVSDEDLENLPLPSKNIINVTAFVKTEEIDPIYFQSSYYVEADKTAARPFALLMEALSDKNMIGIATLALRNKERLCALRVLGGTLVIEMLLYPDEIRMDLEAAKPKTKLTKQELQMAHSLVDLMTQKFDPAEYEDHYREALSEMINSKLEGKEVVEAAPSGPAKVVDLMDALRASVEQARGSGGKKSKPKAEKKPSAKSESARGSRATSRKRATQSEGKEVARARTKGAARKRGAA